MPNCDSPSGKDRKENLKNLDQTQFIRLDRDSDKHFISRSLLQQNKESDGKIGTGVRKKQLIYSQEQIYDAYL